MSALGFVNHLPPLNVLARRLDRARKGRLEALLSARRGTLREVADARRALLDDPHEAGACHALGTASSELLRALRDDGRDDAITRGASAIDAALRSTAPELLDLDAFPQGLKGFTMRLLHRVNVALGQYDLWTRAIVDALGARAGAHVYDLAAGAGGYARHLARHPPAGRALRVTSSDLSPDYVAIGREAARREGVEGVAWEARDALDLRELRARGDVDLFFCSQAVHHLSPGQAVRMISQAVNAAPGGVLVVDLYRSASAALGGAAIVALAAPFPVLVYDGFQSARRAYTPAEFELLARLAGAKRIDARALGPGHCTLHARGA